MICDMCKLNEAKISVEQVADEKYLSVSGLLAKTRIWYVFRNYRYFHNKNTWI